MSSLRQPWRKWLSAAALLMSLLATGAYARFGESALIRGAFMLSIVLLLAATIGSGASRVARHRSGDLPRRPAMLLLAVLLAVAAALRFVDLRDLPLAFQGDMAQRGLGSRELLATERWFTTGWANIPMLGTRSRRSVSFFWSATICSACARRLL